VFASKSGNTFLNLGATYPNQTFTGWIPPASPVNKSPMLSRIEGKRVKVSSFIKNTRSWANSLQDAETKVAVAKLFQIAEFQNEALEKLRQMVEEKKV
jgi:hypothetical protein